MKKNTFISRELTLLILISLCFAGINLLTILWNTIPWLDEIMIIDTPVNFHLDGQWRTTAWYAGGEQSPFATYLPLYQFILAVWLKVFGFSVFAVKSFNIFLTFGTSLISLVLLKKLKPDLQLSMKVLFIILFWIGGVFFEIYRMGRIDVLTITTSFLFLIVAFNYIHSNKKPLLLIITAFFVFFSGIQACVFVVLALFWAYIFIPKKRNKILKAGFYLIIGTIINLLFLLAFFYFNDHLFAFLVSIVSFSTTLRRIVVLLLPFFGPWFNLDVEGIISKVNLDADSPSFFSELSENYLRNPDYLIIIVLAAITYICVWVLYKRKDLKSLSLLGFALFIPLLMTIAGRYAIYYTWMGYLTVLFAFVSTLDMIKAQKLKYVLALLSVLIISSIGLPMRLYQSKIKTYEKLEAFIKKQKFNDSDCVAAPFSVYFPLRDDCRNSYFIGIYPPEDIPCPVNYLITDNVDYEGKLQNYKSNLISSGKTVILKDSCELLNLRVFQIK